MILEYTAIMFLLICTLHIGRAVSLRVPDEIQPSRKYLKIATDALLILLAALALHEFSIWLALVVAILLAIAVSWWDGLPRSALHGIIMGLALATSANIILIWILLLNYLLGMHLKPTMLARETIVQPLGALLFLVFWMLI